jgi:hypothetical protein
MGVLNLILGALYVIDEVVSSTLESGAYSFAEGV